MIERIIDVVAGLAGYRLVLATAGLAFAETAIFLDVLIPGEVGMVVVGASADRAGTPLAPLIVAAVLGATLGDLCSFVIGRRYGVSFLERWSLTRRALPSVERAEQHFERHGGRTVFLARWVGALRAVVPLVAGAAGMPFGRFILWNVAASMAWATTIVTLGYVVGQRIAGVVDRVGALVSLAVVAALVAWFVWRRRQRRAAAPAS